MQSNAETMMEGERAGNGIGGRETNARLLEKHTESRSKTVIRALKGKGKGIYRYCYVLSTPLHRYAGIRTPLPSTPAAFRSLDVLQEYVSVARLTGAAPRSRCLTVYMERGTKSGRK